MQKQEQRDQDEQRQVEQGDDEIIIITPHTQPVIAPISSSECSIASSTSSKIPQQTTLTNVAAAAIIKPNKSSVTVKPKRLSSNQNNDEAIYQAMETDQQPLTQPKIRLTVNINSKAEDNLVKEILDNTRSPQCTLTRLPGSLIPSLTTLRAAANSTAVTRVSAGYACQVMQIEEKRMSREIYATKTTTATATTATVTSSFVHQHSSALNTVKLISGTSGAFKTTVSTSAIKNIATPSRPPPAFQSVINLNSATAPNRIR